MATAAQAIYTMLAANTGVTGLVSTRISPNYAPQANELPFLIYTSVDSTHEHNMGGASSMRHSRVQIDSYATTYASVQAIAEAVRLALDSFVGYVDVGTERVEISKLFIETTRDLYEPSEDASQRGIHRVSQDFMVTITEKRPVHTGA